MLDEKSFKKHFAQKINKLRKEQGMTQFELAEKLNYSDKAISKWERQESLPDAFTIYKIAKFFDVSIEELFTDSHELNEPIIQKENTRGSLNPKRIFIPLIVSLGVLFIFSVIFFIMTNIPSVSPYALHTFLFALPAVSTVLTVFSAMWWQLKYACSFTSILIWSIGFALFYTLNLQSAELVFLPCAVLQVACILVYVFVYFLVKGKK